MKFLELQGKRALREELAQLQSACQTLTAQRDELAERLQALEIEHQRIVIDAGALAVQRDEGAQLLKTLEVERHCMATEAAIVAARQDDIAERLKALAIQHQHTVAEAEALAAQRDELAQKLKALEAEDRRLAAESVTLAIECNELGSRLEALEAENQIIASERTALTFQCDGLAERLQTLEAEPQPVGYPPDMSGFVHLRGGKNLFWFNSADSREGETARFMIFTKGNCGTIWLAASLNLNEQIYCHMGIDHPIETLFRYQMHKDGPAMLLASQAEHYRHGSRLGYMLPPPSFDETLQKYGLDYKVPARDLQGLATYQFDELEGLPGISKYRALGSVHSFSAIDFYNQYQNNPNILGNRRVVTLNMIRHPVPRTESFINAFVIHQVDAYRNTIDQFIEQNLAECRALEARYHISMKDRRVRSFLWAFRIGHSTPWAANELTWVANELNQFRTMKTLKLESLQNDPDYFANAVSILSNGLIIATKAYLDEVFRPENLAVGRATPGTQGTRPPGARDQWEKWSDWERSEFARIYWRDGIEEAYAEYDYDFSFVGRRHTSAVLAVEKRPDSSKSPGAVGEEPVVEQPEVEQQAAAAAGEQPATATNTPDEPPAKMNQERLAEHARMSLNCVVMLQDARNAMPWMAEITNPAQIYRDVKRKIFLGYQQVAVKGGRLHLVKVRGAWAAKFEQDGTGVGPHTAGLYTHR